MYLTELIADGNNPQVLKQYRASRPDRQAIVFDEAERAAARFKKLLPADTAIRMIVRDNGRVVISDFL